MRLLTTIIILMACQSASAWQWRITERAKPQVTCVNGQCVSTVKESRTVQNTKPASRMLVPVPGPTASGIETRNAVVSLAPFQQKSIKFDTFSDCPDGRCPLLPKLGSSQQPPMKSNTPTPAPGAIVERPAAPVLRSVMKQPVRTVVRWRPFARWRR